MKETAGTLNVTDALRQAIWEGSYKAGEWLRQDEIANELAVSRMPVREALRQLESEGLVEFQPHKGAVVRALTAQEIEELFSIRVLLEKEGARRGTPRLTDADIEYLAKQLERMKSVMDISDYLMINKKFHRTIYEASRWNHLLGLIDSLRVNVERYLRFYLGSLEYIDYRHVEHLDIMHACEQRDGEAAAQKTAQHIEATGEAMLRVLRRANLVR